MHVICQLCLTHRATRQATVDGPSGRPRVAHYCDACYQARVSHPPESAPPAPRPTFTIRGLLGLAAGFAAANALVAWLVRSGAIRGTPSQVRQAVALHFLIANLALAALVALYYTAYWIGRVQWHRRTGGLVERPRPRPLRGSDRRALALRSGSIVAEMIAVTLLVGWLTPRLWPVQRFNLRLWFGLLMVLNIFRLAVSCSRNARLRGIVRSEWQAALWPERLSRGMGIVWGPVGLILLFVVPWRPEVMLSIFATWMCGMLALGLAATYATRCR